MQSNSVYSAMLNNKGLTVRDYRRISSGTKIYIFAKSRWGFPQGEFPKSEFLER